MKVIGHRGCRGVMPENTIEAFEHALRIGVKAIELDVVVNGEGNLLVSHEPYMGHHICMHPDYLLTGENERKHNIYTLSQNEINRYDCGTVIHPDFPLQAKFPVRKPLLDEVLNIYLPQKVEIFAEIKSESSDYGIHQPYPLQYAELLVRELRPYSGFSNLIIMSFDIDLLNEIAAISSDFHLALVTEADVPIRNQLDKLHFHPVAVCPRFDLAKKIFAEKMHGLPFDVYPWTVNTTEDLKTLKGLEIQGIITDYPGRFIRLG